MTNLNYVFLRQLLLIFGLFIGLSFQTFSQSSDNNSQKSSVWSTRPNFTGLYFDQDLFVSNNEDRDYTMGLGFNFSVASDANVLWRLTEPVDEFLHIDEIRSKHFPDSSTYNTSIGIAAFTPDDLAAEDPILDDRPYSSILSFSWLHTSVDREGKRSLTTQFTIGIIGIPGIAERPQTWFHQAYRKAADKDTPVDPQGWDNQISDGGEPTALYALSLQQELYTLETNEEQKFLELTSTLGGSIGYYTMAQAGVQARLGLINSAFYSHDINPGSSINKSRNDASAKYKYMLNTQPKNLELYLFVRYTGYAVGYNALLQGQFFDSEHELNASELEPFFYEEQYGAAFRYKSIRVSYSEITRSEEHELTQAREHSWGSLQVECRIPF